MKLKKHLRTQIQAAEKIDSKWVYILQEEAEKCLKLAETEDTLLADPVHGELEGGGNSWWYVCSDCRTSISSQDRFCRGCGKLINW